MFQSTHLQEVRRFFVDVLFRIFNGFNPRTYKRCDSYAGATPSLLSWFQSTHLQEVRLLISIYHNHLIKVSIHAPTRGTTIGLCERGFHFCVSIHAPTRGATNAYPYLLGSIYVSIHAPTRGATQKQQTKGLELYMFQSTHLQEVRHPDCLT